MSYEATQDALDVMLGIEKRKTDRLCEISEIDLVMRGLSVQVEGYEDSGHFHVGRQVYISSSAMLAAQCDFSSKYDGMVFEHEWDLPRVLPEVKKVVELLERFRIHEETEDDVERAMSYLAILHQYLVNEQRPRRRGCFG